jgi:hypothetical protein
MTRRFNRNLAVDALVDFYIDSISSTNEGEFGFIRDILVNGFSGYNTWDDLKLIEECMNSDIPEYLYFESEEE